MNMYVYSHYIAINVCMCVVVYKRIGRGNHTFWILKMVGGFPEVVGAKGLGTYVITDSYI